MNRGRRHDIKLESKHIYSILCMHESTIMASSSTPWPIQYLYICSLKPGRTACAMGPHVADGLRLRR